MFDQRQLNVVDQPDLESGSVKREKYKRVINIQKTNPSDGVIFMVSYLDLPLKRVVKMVMTLRFKLNANNKMMIMMKIKLQ